MKKRGIAILLAVATLFPYAIKASAQPQSTSAPLIKTNVSSSGTRYADYILENEELIGEGK